MTARDEARAKQAYDQLIQLGGRPSRSLQMQPTWNVAYIHGFVFMTDDEGETEGTISNDIDPMNHHWSEESEKFQRELERWQRFRACQRKSQHQERLDTELELDNTEEALIIYLTKLSDWQEFEMFQGLVYADAVSFEDRCRGNFLWIMDWEATAERSSDVHGAICRWLFQMMRCQEELEAAKKDLDWIKDQWPKIIAEVVDSVSKTPKLQSSLEAKFRKQAYAAFNAILSLGGRASHNVSPPHGSLDALQRVLHWSSETSKYMKELSEWKMFLEWRRCKLGDASTMQGQLYRCPTYDFSIDALAEFEEFRRFEYDTAMSWLKCWQRVVRWHEEEQKTPNPLGWLDDYVKVARSHMTNSEQKLTDAAMRLEKSMQEHSYALSQHGKPMRGETRTEPPPIHILPTPPPSSSGSSRSSQSLSSSCSPPSTQSSTPSQSSQYLTSSCSPPSTQSSAPSQHAQSPEPLFRAGRSLNKDSSASKRYRRSRKEDARKRRGKTSNTSSEQRTLPQLVLVPHQVEDNDDIEMMDVPEDQSLVEANERFETPEAKDTVMTDLEEPSQCTPCASRSQSEHLTNGESENVPSSGAPNRISRKTRSRPAKKVDQALSGKVPRKGGKKPAKKAKTFTEEQKMTLLDAASTNESPMDSPPLRRSERLIEKAVASVPISSPPIATPQFDTIQASPSSEQKQPLHTIDPVEPLRPSRRTRSKKQLNALEPPQTSRSKKYTLSKPVIEPSRSSRRKKFERMARDAARQG